METIHVLRRYLTDNEEALFLKKGFKPIKTYSIPSGLYEGDVITFSVPDELQIYPTTKKNSFLIIHNGIRVCEIYYPCMKTAGMISLNLKANYWR